MSNRLLIPKDQRALILPPRLFVAKAPALILPGCQPIPIRLAPNVTPGSQTFDSGSGDFIVPAYNTLDIELWGGGASGSGGGAKAPAKAAGNNGAASTITSKSLSAGGGNGPASATSSQTQAGGTGGTASGGDTNTNGNAGGSITSISQTTAGNGGSSPNGGTGGVAPSPAGTGFGVQAGNQGGAPGAGSSGVVIRFTSGEQFYRGTAGGGSGAYVKKTYVFGVTSGYPSVADLLAYVVGAAGASSTGSGAYFGTSPAGQPGRVKFTWA